MEKVGTYSTSGSFLYALVTEHDLVSEYQEPDYRWFNVYSGWVTNFFHETKEKALNGPRSTPHGPLDGNYVGTYRIDLITGDILKEED